MKPLTLLLFLLPFLTSAQYSRAERERYEPPYAVGQALLPGLLGIIGGAMNTEHTRGKVVQQGIFFSAALSVGGWGKQPAKRRFFNGICFIAGCAVGVALKQSGR